MGLRGALIAQAASGALWVVAFCLAFSLSRGWGVRSGFLLPLVRPVAVSAALGAVLWGVSRSLPAPVDVPRWTALAAGIGIVAGTTALGMGATVALGQFDRADLGVALHFAAKLLPGRAKPGSVR